MSLHSTHEQAASKQGVISPVTSAATAITKTTDVFKLTAAISGESPGSSAPSNS